MLQVVDIFDKVLQSIHLELKGEKVCIPILFQKTI